MSAAVVTDAQAQAPKFSRYRSVRKAVLATSPEDAPPTPVNHDASPLNRAPSRYHRATRPRTQTLPLPTRPAFDHATLPTKCQHPIAKDVDRDATQQPTQHLVGETSPPSPPSPPHLPQQIDQEVKDGPVREKQALNTTVPRHDRHLSRAATTATRARGNPARRSYEAAREEARMILEGEYDRLQKMKEEQSKCTGQKTPHISNSKRRPTVVQQPQQRPVYVDAPKLSIKMKIDRTMPEKFHDAPQSIGVRKQKSGENCVKPDSSQEVKDQSSPPPLPRTVKLSVAPSAPVPAPALVSVPRTAPTAPAPAPPLQHDASKFDAPVSAVNAGDRRVEVRLNNAERGITLPVTPSTNSRDLLNSASIVMSEDFDPRTCILVEFFSKVGLERPLRRYEHIRDVMNSWDSDDQNYLTIMTESECQATGLERDEAPETPPRGTMLQMHLSLRPGKWDRRWVILRPDGQVTMSKQENDGEGTNICHLSDFDVYTPTPKQRRKVRPPKKICFAIKSQQKSAMFLEGINFVHFFATSDKHVADEWYTAVQSWRSWYLVHVLGEGVQKTKEPMVGTTPAGTGGARPTTAHSTDSIPYQLGSFQPLLDLNNLTFGKSLGDNNENTDADVRKKNVIATKKPSVDLSPGKTNVDRNGTNELTIRRGSRQQGMPPSSFPPRGLIEGAHHRSQPSQDSINNTITTSTTDQAFTGGGLLGRSMSTTRRSRDGKVSYGQVTGSSPCAGISIGGLPGKPLLDLTPASDFAEGSLLRKLEARSMMQGENELKIDRQKRIEADVRVGEGY